MSRLRGKVLQGGAPCLLATEHSDEMLRQAALNQAISATVASNTAKGVLVGSAASQRNFASLASQFLTYDIPFSLGQGALSYRAV